MAGAPPTLFLVVDAIPYDVAEEAWARGLLPGFAAPRPMVSVFPALTHVAVPALLFGAFGARPPGYEVRYLHPPSGEIRGGFGSAEAEAALRPLRVRPDGNLDHAAIYPLPVAASRAQIRWILHRFAEERGDWLGYLWATDAVGHFRGREGLLEAFADVCAEVEAARRALGAEVVLCSDHGMATGRLVHLDARELAAHLAVFGFAEDAGEADRVVLAPFGDVSAGVVHVHRSRADAVAEAVVTAPGVNLAFSVAPRGFRAWRARGGRIEHARVERAGSRWRYRAEEGDPLDLVPLWRGLADAEGLVSDAALFRATLDHGFPDPLHRVHGGLHHVVRWPAAVLFSMEPGHSYGPTWTYAGAEALGGQVGTHGALDRASSLGFVASTLPDPWPGRTALRPEEVLVPWADRLRAATPPG